MGKGKNNCITFIIIISKYRQMFILTYINIGVYNNNYTPDHRKQRWMAPYGFQGKGHVRCRSKYERTKGKPCPVLNIYTHRVGKLIMTDNISRPLYR